MPFNTHNKIDNIIVLVLLIRKTNTEKLSFLLAYCCPPNVSADLLSGSVFWEQQVLQ